MARTRRHILNEIVRETGISIDWDDFEAVLTFARLLKVPATEKAMRNFLAAYMRLQHRWPAREVDEKIASSSIGRRLWEKKLLKEIYDEKYWKR